MNVSQMKKALERAKGSIKNVKAKAEEAIQTAVTSGETVGTAFLTGYARGRMGDANGRWLVGNVDVDLAGGLGMHVVGFVISDKLADHAHAIGNGALSTYGAFKGFEWGRESKKKTAGRAAPEQLPAHQPRVTMSAFDQAFAKR